MLPLVLPMLSPRVRMEMPLKLLALVTGGRRLRMEPSESVLLHGRGSSDFISLSVLLWRLPEARFKLSRLPLQRPAVRRHLQQKGAEAGPTGAASWLSHQGGDPSQQLALWDSTASRNPTADKQPGSQLSWACTARTQTLLISLGVC